MSGKTLKFVLDGDTYEVPEEEAGGLLDELRANGVNVETSSASGGASAGDGASATMEAPASPPQTAPRESSSGDWIDELTNPENLESLAAGGVHGATMGLGRLLPSGLGGDTYRAWDDAHRDSAWYTGGDLGGSLALNTLVPGSGYVANIGKAAVEGAARAFSDSNPDEGVGDAASQGLLNAGVSALAGAIPHGGRAVLRYARDALPEKALINRVAAAGPYGGQMKRMAQNHGDDYLPKLGEAIEERGLHLRDPNATGGRWNPRNWAPAGWGTYADNATDLERDALSRMSSAEDTINALPASRQVDVDVTPIAQQQLDRAAGLRRTIADPAGATQAAEREAQALGLQGKAQASNPVGPNAVQMPNGQWTQVPPPAPTYSMPFGDALENRRFYDQQIDWNRLGGADASPMREAVRRELAGNMRAGLGQGLDDAVAQGKISQRLADKWKGGRDDYAVAAAVRDPSVGRVFQEYGNQVLSLPSAMNAGGAIGAGNPLGAIASAGLGQAIKHYGHGILSDVQHVGAGIGNAADAFANRTGPVGYVAKHLPDYSGFATVHELEDRPDPAQDDNDAINALVNTGETTQATPSLPPSTAPQGDVYDQIDENDPEFRRMASSPITSTTPQVPGFETPQDQGSMFDGSQGQNLVKNVLSVLDNNPSLLGPYMDQFDAADSSDEISALVERLAKTDKRFAKYIYPQLVGGTP